MSVLFKNCLLVNEGLSYAGGLLVDGELISDIFDYSNEADCMRQQECETLVEEVIDLDGRCLAPGVIDDHVHFREPGSEHKGCIATESAAAALGGVTSYMDMPNNTPAAVTIAALEAKEAIAKRDSTVNYSFYLGAAANRLDQIRALDASKVCGVKVFIGSSTGSLLVEDKSVLDVIFATSPVLIAVHAEDNAVISANMAEARSRYGDDIPFFAHPDIRSREACIKATKFALSLAEKHGSKLHIMHISTQEEAELIREAATRGVKVTGEVCVSYLMFNRDDYARYGAQIKCNPAIKERTDMLYLREAVKSGLLPVIGTDHAPHLLSEKNAGSYAKSPSGIPMVQHSLLAMLELVNQGVLTLESVIERMCHAPADLFNIKGRGYLRKGYFADLVAFDRSTPSQPEIASRCGWAPLNSFSSTILHTMVNGEFVVRNSALTGVKKGYALIFERKN